MKKILLVVIFTICSIISFAQDHTSATWNAKMEKFVVSAKVNGVHYSNVYVLIESSKQGYVTTYTSGYLAGMSSVTYPWVKIKITNAETKKKIYSKKLKRSCLFLFDSGTHIQIGQPDNVSTEAFLDKKEGGWELIFDENGDL